MSKLSDSHIESYLFCKISFCVHMLVLPIAFLKICQLSNFQLRGPVECSLNVVPKVK